MMGCLAWPGSRCGQARLTPIRSPMKESVMANLVLKDALFGTVHRVADNGREPACLPPSLVELGAYVTTDRPATCTHPLCGPLGPR
jgi:hypothetical protein